jgi:uncharacterized protein (TIGR02145 family)
MKGLILCFFFMVYFNPELLSQNLRIHTTDGATMSIPLGAIDSITFASEIQAFECGVSKVMDIDGNLYKTTQIGEQCWMAENLKVTKWPSGIITNRMCYDGLDLNCELYGGLYTWWVATGGGAQGLCPDGWHVPGHTEWHQLSAYISGGSSTGGNQLKSCRQVDSPLGGDCNTSEHPRWDSHETHYGTDDYGFSALPGGTREIPNSIYEHIGVYAIWWTSNTYTMFPENAFTWGVSYASSALSNSFGYKDHAYSLRCVKD